jgi:Tfp pilus assembly protein PilN
MKPIYLDFVRKRRRRAILGPLLLLAAVTLSALLGYWIHALQEANRALEAREAYAASTRARAAAALKPITAEEEERLFALVQGLSVPWDRILAALERTTAPEVALLAVQHDPRQGGVRIFAEAKEIPAMLEYLRGLQAERAFASATLENHRVEPQEPGRPVRFQVLAGTRTAP